MSQTVKVTYRLSTKVNPTEKDSPWQSMEVGYETEAEGTQVNLNDVAEELTNQAKAQVFSQLGLQFTEGDNGELVPVFPIADIPTRSRSASQDTGDVGYLTLDGQVYFDYRGSHAKQVNPRFPDFKTKDGEKDQFGKDSHWLIEKDGVTPSEFAKALNKAGLL